MDVDKLFKALANEKRRLVLDWLKDPVAHFPPQVDGDLIEDGVCSLYIAEKLGVSQPTATVHLKSLAQVGLINSKRVKQWTFHKRDAQRIEALKRAMAASF